MIKFNDLLLFLYLFIAFRVNINNNEWKEETRCSVMILIKTIRCQNQIDKSIGINEKQNNDKCFDACARVHVVSSSFSNFC